jgi:MarR family transcriptional regulator, organic hydroperoxide resistance regulator
MSPVPAAGARKPCHAPAPSVRLRPSPELHSLRLIVSVATVSGQTNLPGTAPQASTPPFDLDASLGYVITQTARRMARELHHRLQPYGVTAAQWVVLAVLWQQDGLPQYLIADLIDSDRPTLTAMLKLMVGQGLVRRDRDEADNRYQRVHLTPAGQRLRDQLPPLAVMVNDSAMAGLSPQDRATLISLLNQVRANLSSGPIPSAG